MTPSQQAKEAGLKKLLQIQQLTGQSAQTLTNWHRDKPELLKFFWTKLNTPLDGKRNIDYYHLTPW